MGNFSYWLQVSIEQKHVGINGEISLGFYGGAILRISSLNASFALL